MLQELYERKKVIPFSVINHETLILSSTPVVRDGVIEAVSSFKPVSVCTTYDGFCTSDFAIGNIISMGLLSRQSVVNMSNGDYVSVGDGLDKLVSYVESSDK